jgi:hypothetical protein
MFLSKLVKPAFIVGNFMRGFLDGASDEVMNTFSDQQITRFKDTADLLKNCEPWENHLKRDSYPEINRALN